MGILFDLPPQPADPGVDAAINEFGLTAPGQIEELISREHNLRPLNEYFQQAKFGRPATRTQFGFAFLRERIASF